MQTSDFYSLITQRDILEPFIPAHYNDYVLQQMKTHKTNKHFILILINVSLLDF